MFYILQLCPLPNTHAVRKINRYPFSARERPSRSCFCKTFSKAINPCQWDPGLMTTEDAWSCVPPDAWTLLQDRDCILLSWNSKSYSKRIQGSGYTFHAGTRSWSSTPLWAFTKNVYLILSGGKHIVFIRTREKGIIYMLCLTCQWRWPIFIRYPSRFMVNS